MNNQNPFSVAPGRVAEVTRGFCVEGILACLVSGSDTEGRTAIFEGVASPGAGPILHLHHSQNAWWYVLEGDFLFQVGDEKFNAQPGASIFGPRGVPHAFRCVGKQPGKMLLAFDPAGQIEEFFVEIAKPGVEDDDQRDPERHEILEYNPHRRKSQESRSVG